LNPSDALASVRTRIFGWRNHMAFGHLEQI
jgi:hypothetical protein